MVRDLKVLTKYREQILDSTRTFMKVSEEVFSWYQSNLGAWAVCVYHAKRDLNSLVYFHRVGGN